MFFVVHQPKKEYTAYK